MSARCLDKSSPRCVLPTSGVAYTCPHCHRIWERDKGLWWFRGKKARRKT